MTLLKTDPEHAQIQLLTLNQKAFKDLLGPTSDISQLKICLYYFQALSQINRDILIKKKILSEEELANFQSNRELLLILKKEIIEEELTGLFVKYNESCILSALIYAIRENESNIKKFDNYLALKEKFLSFPKLNSTYQFIIYSWNDFNHAIQEVEDWLREKSTSFLPIVEKLVKKFDENNSITAQELFIEIHDMNEREIFYLLTNILLTNPFLHNEMQSMTLFSKQAIEDFEFKLMAVLNILEEKTATNELKGLIKLFKKQISQKKSKN